MQSFVALDLELTPFSSEQQRIIEVAAARFRGAQLIETFSSLVDPRCGLNLRVEMLTGIRQAELKTAPPLDDVMPRFLSFLGSDPIVGQSIELDMEQLAACGVRLTNRTYDTFELATILIPGLPSYDLGTVARHLGVEVEQQHRALGDAIVSSRVFLALLRLAEELGVEVLTSVDALARQVQGWPLADIFRDALRNRVRENFVRSGAEGRGPLRSPAASRGDEDGSPPLLPPLESALPGIEGKRTLRPAAQKVAVDTASLQSLMGPGGAVTTRLTGFEKRDEQLRMMSAVAEALNEGSHLLVEAGTGTGKSLAYLLPAIYFATANERPVVISTNTVNLQDQLFQKDLPALQDCLSLPFRAALLKGRANYLCLRRWMTMSKSPELSREELLLLIKTLIWLARTETGDKAELSLSSTDAPLWSRIAAQRESCAMGRCSYFRGGNCFVSRARRKAQNAHIVVVNHALLLSDLAMSGGVLPEYSHLVIDESHHLEEEATDQLGFTLSSEDLASTLRTLYQVTSGHWPVGFLSELQGALRGKEMTGEEFAGIKGLLAEAMSAVDRVREQQNSFFEALHCFIMERMEGRARTSAPLRITTGVRAQPGWSEIEVRWGELADRIRGLRGLLYRVSTRVDLLEESQILEREGVLADLAGFLAYLDDLLSHGDEIISSPSTEGIYWAQGGGAAEQLLLRSAPLHVGEVLNEALFSNKETVILTSATLTAEGCFDYVRERLGLEDARELVVGSPFDYRNSTMLYLAQDIPEPSKPTCQRAVEKTIAETVLRLGGRTLVLFTSHAQLRQTSSAIRARLEQQGILVLAHGLDGSRRRLLQAFRSSPRAVLMGTSSFWEGIDVVGDALSCLIIVKLPFAVPTDPVFEARSETFEEPFRQYSMPQTILKFKQGFGRLIRSRSDRGVVAVLDSRVGSKFYGPAFIQSLPECTLVRGPADRLSEKAAGWLERTSAAAKATPEQ